MFVAVGNGDFDQTASPYTTATDWGESMLKFSTSGALTVSSANTLNWFTPNNWQSLNSGDLDLGASGLLLLPDQAGGSHPHLLITGGKGGVMYVVDRDDMGGLNTPDSAVQEFNTPDNNYAFVTPAYFNGNIYYAASGSPLEQRTVGYDATTGNYISPASIKSDAGVQRQRFRLFHQREREHGRDRLDPDWQRSAGLRRHERLVGAAHFPQFNNRDQCVLPEYQV